MWKECALSDLAFAVRFRSPSLSSTTSFPGCKAAQRLPDNPMADAALYSNASLSPPPNAVDLLLLIENSQEMARVWNDLKDRYLGALVQRIQLAHQHLPANPTVWVLESQPLRTDATPDIRQYYDHHSALLDVQLNTVPENRLSYAKVDEAANFLASLRSPNEERALHLVVIAASSPRDSPLESNSSGYHSPWYNLAHKLGQANIHCHLLMRSIEDMSALTTLFEETLRTQSNLEDPFPIPVDVNIIIRLSMSPNQAQFNPPPQSHPQRIPMPPRRNTFPQLEPGHYDDQFLQQPPQIQQYQPQQLQQLQQQPQDSSPSLVTHLQQVHGLTKKKVYGAKPTRPPFFKDADGEYPPQNHAPLPGPPHSYSNDGSLPPLSGRAMSQSQVDRLTRMAQMGPTDPQGRNPLYTNGSRAWRGSPEVLGNIDGPGSGLIVNPPPGAFPADMSMSPTSFSGLASPVSPSSASVGVEDFYGVQAVNGGGPDPTWLSTGAYGVPYSAPVATASGSSAGVVRNLPGGVLPPQPPHSAPPHQQRYHPYLKQQQPGSQSGHQVGYYQQQAQLAHQQQHTPAQYVTQAPPPEFTLQLPPRIAQGQATYSASPPVGAMSPPMGGPNRIIPPPPHSQVSAMGKTMTPPPRSSSTSTNNSSAASTHAPNTSTATPSVTKSGSATPLAPRSAAPTSTTSTSSSKKRARQPSPELDSDEEYIELDANFVKDSTEKFNEMFPNTQHFPDSNTKDGEGEVGIGVGGPGTGTGSAGGTGPGTGGSGSGSPKVTSTSTSTAKAAGAGSATSARAASASPKSASGLKSGSAAASSSTPGASTSAVASASAAVPATTVAASGSNSKSKSKSKAGSGRSKKKAKVSHNGGEVAPAASVAGSRGSSKGKGVAQALADSDGVQGASGSTSGASGASGASGTLSSAPSTASSSTLSSLSAASPSPTSAAGASAARRGSTAGSVSGGVGVNGGLGLGLGGGASGASGSRSGISSRSGAGIGASLGAAGVDVYAAAAMYGGASGGNATPQGYAGMPPMFGGQQQYHQGPPGQGQQPVHLQPLHQVHSMPQTQYLVQQPQLNLMHSLDGSAYPPHGPPLTQAGGAQLQPQHPQHHQHQQLGAGVAGMGVSEYGVNVPAEGALAPVAGMGSPVGYYSAGYSSSGGMGGAMTPSSLTGWAG